MSNAKASTARGLDQAPVDPDRPQITVLVPTFRRPSDLSRCVEALGRQMRPADQIVIVVRESDEETSDFLAGFDSGPLPLQVVRVSEAGVIAAMNAGLGAARGEILALTDDDAAPHPDWLLLIERALLQNEKIGGVGGRDWVHHGEEVDRGSATVVGKVQWFGRLIGNHRRGVGGPREVDVLKGVNCAYRTACVRQVKFDDRLWGEGAQVHWELSLGFALRGLGYKLIYDPAIQVDHFESRRFDEDQRVSVFFQPEAQRNAVHNETLIMLQYLPAPRRLAFLAWSIMVGTRTKPGLLQLVRLLACRSDSALPRWKATVGGHRAGMGSFIHWGRNS